MEVLSFKVARYLPSFSMNYVAILPQRFGKITTTATLDRDENLSDQGYNDIGVVIATK